MIREKCPHTKYVAHVSDRSLNDGPAIGLFGKYCCLVYIHVYKWYSQAESLGGDSSAVRLTVSSSIHESDVTNMKYDTESYHERKHAKLFMLASRGAVMSSINL